MVKNQLANAEETSDVGSILRLERSLGEGDGYSLQYSYLENPTDRGAWHATALGVVKKLRFLMSLCKNKSVRETAVGKR